MSAATDGTISAIWRYPVKSMAGEQIPATHVTERGLAGDRAYALVDVETNRAAVVRTWGVQLLRYLGRFQAEPEAGKAPPPVHVHALDGAWSALSHSEIETHFSTIFQRPLRLLSEAPAGLLVEFPKGTLGGQGADITEAPLADGAPAGTFFDAAQVHLVATSTLEHLQAAYPETKVDARRFRPNLVVDTAGAPFVENSWVGHEIAIGTEVILRVTMSCPRCINVVAEQPGLPKQATLLRTIASMNAQDFGEFGRLPCVGVYAEVVRGGRVRLGDDFRVLA